jgi:hypothetical protein
MANYIEFILTNFPYPDGNKINVSLSQKRFEELLKKVKSNGNQKAYHKSFKVYVRDNLYLEAEKDSEIRVYEKDPVSLSNQSRYLVARYKKLRVPMHTFPSTMKIHTVYHSDLTIFRMHNRVFLNFEVQYYPSLEAFVYKIFINYNHDQNAEQSNITEKIQCAFKLLGEQVPISETFHETDKPFSF